MDETYIENKSKVKKTLWLVYMLVSIHAMLIPTRLAGWLVVRQPALRRWTLVNLKDIP